MKFNHTNILSSKHLLLILILQSLFCLVVFLDIPIARQVIGFIYLTLVPGFVVIKLLKLDGLDRVETVLFSEGLSVAFLMLVGLLMNELFRLIGIPKPLSVLPLMITLNSTILAIGILNHLKVDTKLRFSIAESSKIVLFALPLICLPILSIFGALWISAFENSSILVFMMTAISIFFVSAVFCKRLTSPSFYAISVLMIAVALLLYFPLSSLYINGHDIHHEYHIFKVTDNSSYWNSTLFRDPWYGRFNAMLSITILPTIYSNVLNLEGTWVLKIVFPLLFSLVPLGLFRLWKEYIGEKGAFISTFLFMAQATFYSEMVGLARQMIAELFFLLLFYVLLKKEMNSSARKACFMIFGFALVVSHYAISAIFLFTVVFAWAALFLVKKKSKNLSVAFIMLFFTIFFSWYIYVSASASFETFLQFGNDIVNSLRDFFNPSSRGTEVLRGVGAEAPPSLWHVISRMFAYATQALIVVGFIILFKRKSANFDREYVTFSSLSMTLLLMCLLLPSFASSLNMSRFYHIALFFLAPFFLLGCKTIIGFFSRRKTELYILILVVNILVPYFLFQTDLVYEVAGVTTWSPPLSMYRMGVRPYLENGYLHELDVSGAIWLSNYLGSSSQIHRDTTSSAVLIDYGGASLDRMKMLSNTTTIEYGEVVYLSRINVVYGVTVGQRNSWNTTSLSPIFNDLNKIYSNGGCEFYEGSGG